jgi:histidinol-phosphate/aromatic aminotransferase/cobyric acid decarboxylase-like protein
MTLNEIVAVANFLGDSITKEQVDALMDEARVLSVAEREALIELIDGLHLMGVEASVANFIGFRVALSENRAESRWDYL